MVSFLDAVGDGLVLLRVDDVELADDTAHWQSLHQLTTAQQGDVCRWLVDIDDSDVDCLVECQRWVSVIRYFHYETEDWMSQGLVIQRTGVLNF